MNATSRPWLVTASAAVVLAVALLVVPISYDVTTGERVTLTLAGVKDPLALPAVAEQMKAALGAPVRIEESGATSTLTASVPSESHTNVALVANAFARELEARGYDASVATEPIKERVLGSVYAYARDVVVKVDVADKSAAQIEEEIRQQLAAAGLSNTQVTVTESGANQRKVTMELKHEATAGEELPGSVKLELTKNGEELAHKANQVAMKMKQTPDGGKTLELTLTTPTGTNTVEIPHVETMSDAQLSAEIVNRLRAAGISNLDVRMENGRLSVERTP